MKWIIDHSEIDNDKTYIICSIGKKFGSDKTYLYNPQLGYGWQFKDYLNRCYAAIPMPEWQGLDYEHKK